MDVSTLRRLLLEFTSSYFTGANVVFSDQSFAPVADKPLVTLSFGDVQRATNPPDLLVQGIPVSYYPASIMVQVDLFTNGRQLDIDGCMPINENTAVDDLLSFLNYLNSEYAVSWCHDNDIAILIPSTAQDLTNIINDTNYEFRAMCELQVDFTIVAIGHTGTLDVSTFEGNEIPDVDDTDKGNENKVDPVIKPTESGGGNPEMVGNEGGYFENVVVNDKLMKEDK